MTMLRKLCALALIAALAACTPPTATAPEAPVETASIGDLAIVDAPAPGARVTSPLTITGTAPGNWYFENQFPVRLVDAQGAVIAEAPATPRVSWTDPGDKEFDATLTFSVTADTPATLVLEEDMPGEGNEPRQVRIDVVLAAQ
ncbi:MAG: hypothetical protein DCF16_05420 [Alphaproteobacteria bacterium]|nr:MAG: hypothetical protein DCF16_05420 [Alphaproteobacteria bacterium]